MYFKIAKLAVWSSTLIFITVLVFLLISILLGNQKYVSTALMVLLVMGLPLSRAFQYVTNPVGKAVRKLQFLENQELLNFIKPLLNGIDSNVSIGHYESDELNAFAISSVFGKDSAIAFSTALINTMSPNQLLAIAAHEVAHIKNSDSKNKSYILAFHNLVNFYPELMSHIAKELIKGVSGIILLIAIVTFLLTFTINGYAGVSVALQGILPLLMPLLLIAVPIAGAFALNRLTDMFFFHYSRQREYVADADGAAMTSNADMKQALQLLSNDSTSKMGFFDTHPPICDRLSRLK